VIEGKRIIAIIPARGGSKGLPGKNIKPLLGKPLLSWTIEQANASRYIDDIFVSTDSPDIAAVSESFGVKVPELRPDHLASDTSSSMDVVDYVLNHYEERKQFFDYILLLEPTSPMRKKSDIDSAIELLFRNPSADGVVSLGEVHMEHPMIVKKVTENNKIVPYLTNTQKIHQRQQADKAYFPYGVVYLVKASVFKEKHGFYTDNILPYFIERWQCYELDDIFDLYCIETIFKHILEGKV
jgi:CMP-N-acetylneuraminic acid synthetase